LNSRPSSRPKIYGAFNITAAAASSARVGAATAAATDYKDVKSG
jgi:hypothetical protein